MLLKILILLKLFFIIFFKINYLVYIWKFQTFVETVETLKFQFWSNGFNLEKKKKSCFFTIGFVNFILTSDK